MSLNRIFRFYQTFTKNSKPVSGVFASLVVLGAAIFWLVTGITACQPDSEPSAPSLPGGLPPQQILTDIRQTDSSVVEAALALAHKAFSTGFDSVSYAQYLHQLDTLSQSQPRNCWGGITNHARALMYILGPQVSIDSSIYYHEKAVKNYRDIPGSAAQLEKALTYLGYLYSMQNRWEEAKAMHEEAERRSPRFSLDLSSIRSKTLSQIAFSNGAYYEALVYLQKSIEYQKIKKGDGDLAILHINLSSILDRANLHREGLIYLEQAKEYMSSYTKQTNHAYGEAQIMMIDLMLSPDTDSARAAYHKGIRFVREIQDIEDEGHLNNWMANYFRFSGQLDSAAHYLELSASIYNNIGLSMYALGERADRMCIQLEQGKLRAVQAQIPDIIKELKADSQNGLLLELYEKLRKAYQKEGLMAQSYHYYQEREQLFNRVFGNNRQEESILKVHLLYIKEQEEKNRLAQQELERQQAAAQLQQQQWITGSTIAGSILLLIITIILYRSYRQKQHSAEKLALLNTNLMDEQEKLRWSNVQLRRFSNVVSHDIMSNLDLILFSGNILLEQSSKTKALQQYYEMSQRTSKQLKAYCLGLLTEMSKDKVSTNQLTMYDPMPAFKSVLRNFEPALQVAQIRCEWGQLSPSPLPEAIVEQLFQNVISNVIRYGATATAPEIKIWEEKDGLGGMIWIINDNGIGINPEIREGIFSDTADIQSSKGQGKGLQLLQSTLAEYGSKLHLESSPNDSGTKVIVTFAPKR